MEYIHDILLSTYSIIRSLVQTQLEKLTLFYHRVLSGIYSTTKYKILQPLQEHFFSENNITSKHQKVEKSKQILVLDHINLNP